MGSGAGEASDRVEVGPHDRAHGGVLVGQQHDLLLGQLALLILLGPGTGSLGRVGEVRECGLHRLMQLRLHLVELLDVPDLELHGLGPGVAHDQQREAVAGHVVGGHLTDAEAGLLRHPRQAEPLTAQI